MTKYLVVTSILFVSVLASADKNTDCIHQINSLFTSNSPVELGPNGLLTQSEAATTRSVRIYKTNNLTATTADYDYTQENLGHIQIKATQPEYKIADAWNGPTRASVSTDGSFAEYYTNSPSRSGCEITKITRGLKGQDRKTITYDRDFCTKTLNLDPTAESSLGSFKKSISDLLKDPTNKNLSLGYYNAGVQGAGHDIATQFYQTVTAQNANLESLAKVRDQCKLEVNELDVAAHGLPRPAQATEAPNKARDSK